MSDNELIAEFMGHSKEYYKSNQVTLRYNISWDVLMPVVEKINSAGYDVDIFADGIDGSHECTIHDTGNVYQCIEDSKSLIGATYAAVVEFIKWWNENGK